MILRGFTLDNQRIVVKNIYCSTVLEEFSGYSIVLRQSNKAKAFIKSEIVILSVSNFKPISTMTDSVV